MQSGAVMRRSLCPSEPSMRTCNAVCMQVWVAMCSCGHTAGGQHSAGIVQCSGFAGAGTAGLAPDANSIHMRPTLGVRKLSKQAISCVLRGRKGRYHCKC